MDGKDAKENPLTQVSETLGNYRYQICFLLSGVGEGHPNLEYIWGRLQREKEPWKWNETPFGDGMWKRNKGLGTVLSLFLFMSITRENSETSEIL